MRRRDNNCRYRRTSFGKALTSPSTLPRCHESTGGRKKPVVECRTNNDTASEMHARSSNSADPVIDLLGQFLRDLRPAEASYCRAEVTRPWGIDLQFQKGIRFHFVAEGT
ncbi:MAG: hypothetical protein EOQ42_18820 [Mesorhizobium sp.]|nr:MAG: hypothetical protein EOQ41_21360 [Mesorhizobium sp.]TGT98874.1 hypothetical protein EN807_02700 [Mesorhizobium sp. M5C.F.Ca.ET.164.01.1.1]RWB29419.1 MAG: hypothetical protein EOQ43_19725 [Mesorhizobium sp.]RWB63272.1 MAG: hypothetical protein EOQ42_18820 [Mesorhizobium sp.]RWC20793.1 MAG: hypothetical protein EOS51_12965 [Mesorhizobium sp.]